MEGFRQQTSATLAQIDSLSETTTLASFETSSTVTVYASGPANSSGADFIDYKASLQASRWESWKQSFLTRIGYGEKVTEDVLILNLLQTISTAAESEIRQYALNYIFVFINGGRYHSVVRGLVYFEPTVFLELLQQLAEYVPTPPDFDDPEVAPRPEPHNVLLLTGAPLKSTQLAANFFVELLRSRWESLTFEDVDKICITFKAQRPLLKLLFPTAAQKAGESPKFITSILTYVASLTSWPSLNEIEDTKFSYIPQKGVITDLVAIIPDCPTGSVAILVQHILEATRPDTNTDPTQGALVDLEGLTNMPHFNKIAPWSRTTKRFLYRHPALPFLWLALYLAVGNAYARSMLIAGGIVDNVRDLYDLDFPDSRVDTEISTKRYSDLDLLRLCHILLHSLFPNQPANIWGSMQASFIDPFTSKKDLDETEREHHWLRAKDLADSLKEFFTQDLRFHRRAMCARFHDGEVVLRDELEAEARDAKFRNVGTAA